MYTGSATLMRCSKSDTRNIFGEGVCVIEWADIIEELIPEDAVVIRIEYGASEGERIYEIMEG